MTDLPCNLHPYQHGTNFRSRQTATDDDLVDRCRDVVYGVQQSIATSISRPLGWRGY